MIAAPLPVIAIVFCALSAMPAATPQSSPASSPSISTSRDGSHDFDFNIGVWHTHIRRVPDPFSDPGKSIEVDGTVSVRKIWNGKAQLEEIEADGPNGHWEGASLFVYNPGAHQWSQTFVSSKVGVLEPPLIGAFNNGRGELFNQDTFQGKTVFVKGVWSDITPDAHHYEELYSNDGGQTWHSTFFAVLTREKATNSDRTSLPGGL